MILELSFVVIYVGAGAVFATSLGQLRRFLGETTAIDGTASLERFKHLARGQMHLALVTLVVLLAGLAVGLALIRQHGVVGLGPVLLANALVFATGLYHKRVETRARDLPCSSVELGEEYRRVSSCWLKKALPDF